MLLIFVSRIILIRYLTQTEYGLFSLGYVLFEVFLVVSSFGLTAGIARQIGFYRGKGDSQKVANVALSGLQIGVVLGVVSGLTLFLASEAISTRFFHASELTGPVRIFSAAVPFLVLVHILTAIFRGFDRAQPSVYFRDILRNVLFCVSLGVAVAFHLPLISAVYAFLASAALAFAAFAIYTARRAPVSLAQRSGIHIGPIRKELLLFSLPLFAVVLLNRIATWTDTIMLGRFMLPSDVGLYNAALPLAHLLPTLLEASAFLYLPLMSQLYARGQTEEIGKSYAVVSKWIFSASMPIFLVFALFPEATLYVLFGSTYAGAASALRILSLGFFSHSILGLSGITLMAAGKTRFLVGSALFTVALNIVLNVFLIPPLGISGAAIATASSLGLRNILVSLKLYSFMRVHPFTNNYLKPALASTILVAVIYALVTNLVTDAHLWLLPLLLVVFLAAYALAVLLTKSFDREDIMMLLALEERLGIDLTKVKRVLRRFV